MIAALSGQDFFTVAAVVVVVGSALQAISSFVSALHKAKPEGDQTKATADQIIVLTAKEAVVMTRELAEDQRQQLADLRSQMDEHERRLNSQLQVALDAQRVAEEALAACIAERREISALYDAERERNRRSEQEFRDRIASLEEQVAALQAQGRQ